MNENLQEHFLLIYIFEVLKYLYLHVGIKVIDGFVFRKDPISDIESIIREIGTFRKKSVYIHEITKKLYDDGYDYVPNDREYIESLPGVGHKTANVFLSNIYNEPSIAVDTHVSRVSKRLGFAKDSDDVNKIEKKLMKIVPKDRWSKTHHQLVLFGRYKCKAINPECNECKIKEYCKKNRT